jgi:hypothetical protein
MLWPTELDETLLRAVPHTLVSSVSYSCNSICIKQYDNYGTVSENCIKHSVLIISTQGFNGLLYQLNTVRVKRD